MNTNQARSWQHSHPQREPDKKVVVKVRKRGWLTKGEKVIYSLLGLLVISLGIYIVSFATSTDTLNREVQSLEAKIEVQQTENEQLIDEIRALSKPERITKIAKENGLKVQDAEVKRAVN